MDKLPYDTLYFKTKIEATRQDRFIGWRPLHGTVWNSWSLLNIRPPVKIRLQVSIESKSAVGSGGIVTLTVRVRDQEGEPVDGAIVRLTVTPAWAGNFSLGGGQPTNDLTASASLGELAVSYIAPDIDFIQNVTITATAGHPEFLEIPEASGSFMISVYPVGEKFLSVRVTTLDSDLVIVSGMMRFEITITGADGFPVDDANVTATTEPPLESPYGLNLSEGTALEMRDLRFLAPPGNMVDLNETPYALVVNASYPGNHNGSSFATFVVVRLFQTCPTGDSIMIDVPCPPGPTVARDLLAATIGALVVALIVTAVAHFMEKKRHWSP